MTVPASSEPSRLRLVIMLIVIGCLFVALLARLWFLQVINVAAAKQQVETSGIVSVYTSAPRGEILDREGQALVDNISVPIIEVEQQDVDDTAMISQLAALLGTSVKALTTTINSNQYSSYEPVPVKEDATPAQILYVQEHPSLFDGVTATTVSQPHVTPLGEYAANLLGYVGPIDAAELKSMKKYGYRAGEEVGIGGAEQEFERQLQGKPGVERIQVSPTNQDLGPVSSTPPVPGHNIRLTIDGPLQKLAVETLEKQEINTRNVHDPVTNENFKAPDGSVVALDPRNGQVLAMASNPTYNPNLFNDGGISEANYKQITSSANGDELLNLPIQGEYAPGSTFKLSTATAGLKYGVFTAQEYYDDTGSIDLGGRTFCDDDCQGAGEVDLTQAITVSSDNYFNTIGIQLWDRRATVGQDAMQKIADGYGFNEPTGIDLPGEYAGVIPTPQLFALEAKEDPAVYGKTQGWYTGDSAITAIGQGQVLVTPLQLANAYAAFANGGTRYKPQVAIDAQTSSGKVVKRYGSSIAGHTPTLTPAERAAMLQGFIGVVNGAGGTATADFAGTPVANEDIAGKTGTAQVQKPHQNTAVFTSFAPASAPRYAIDCFMPEAGYGADAAAPVVRNLYEYLFHKPIQAVTYLGGAASGSSGN